MSTFKFEPKKKGSKIELAIAGRLDENSNLEQLVVGQDTHIEINLKDMTSVNSGGIRVWLNWAHAIEGVQLVTLENCPANFLSMAGVMKNLVPKRFEVRSISLPYFCEKCENAFTNRLAMKNNKRPKSVAENSVCPNCKAMASLDVDPDSFFRFLG